MQEFVQTAAPHAEVAQADSMHPLRVYCEYLSYLFRKPELPAGQELLELGYRDYLQVSFLLNSLACPLCQHCLMKTQTRAKSSADILSAHHGWGK